MSTISRNEFLQMQQERAERQNSFTNRPRVSYFGLKDDGDEAIVRFAYSSPDELEIFTTHQVTIDGRFRRVNCLRGPKEPLDNCPLCASGQNYQNRVYLKLVEYVRNEDGTITPTAKVWERPVSYLQIISNLFSEYGDISDCVFKVKRSGERGSMQTTYNIMFGNPTIYNAQLYPKDFSAFEGYEILGGPLMNKTFTEMQELVSDAAEVEKPAQNNQTFTPQVTLTQPTSLDGTTNQSFGGQRRVIY